MDRNIELTALKMAVILIVLAVLLAGGYIQCVAQSVGG